MKLTSINCRAFTWVDFLIIIAALALLAMVALPRLAKRYARSSKINCTNNLKQIGLAYRQWSLDSGDKFPMQVSVTNGGAMELVATGKVYPVFLVMSNELNTPKILICPEESDRSRVTAATFERAASSTTAGYCPIPFTNDNNVSYFVGLDADATKPAMLLGGDDNFLVKGSKPARGLFQLRTNQPVQWTNQRHNRRGNLVFADGSVASVENRSAAEVLAKTGTATNRLLLPGLK
jgi:prepilin-type processing-associated H-X9-DG protein